MNKKINLETGSVSFWIPEKLFDYDNGKAHILANLSGNGGSILILKDTDNKLKFFHVFLGKGRTDVEIDVSDISSSERHMVTATWDIKDSKKISLYVDGGKKVKDEKILY